MLCRSITRGLAVAAALLFASNIAWDHAQTLYGYDGSGAGIVDEITGPPAGLCGYPNGPLVFSFNTMQPWGCPTPGPALGPNLGDVANDMVNDTVWVTDGLEHPTNLSFVPFADDHLKPARFRSCRSRDSGRHVHEIRLADGSDRCGRCNIIPHVDAPAQLPKSFFRRGAFHLHKILPLMSVPWVSQIVRYLPIVGE